MTKTVLVVEDDEAVRQVLRRALRICRYNVFEAASGNEAVAVCYKYNGSIDLVLADVHLPDMKGTEMARILLAMRPEMKVLYASGNLQETALPAEAAFLQKPFTIAGLNDKIRDVLAEPETLLAAV
jgi:two-component system, cell cycle sensor histidine kinase and response regulator CckA